MCLCLVHFLINIHNDTTTVGYCNVFVPCALPQIKNHGVGGGEGIRCV